MPWAGTHPFGHPSVVTNTLQRELVPTSEKVANLWECAGLPALISGSLVTPAELSLGRGLGGWVKGVKGRGQGAAGGQACGWTGPEKGWCQDPALGMDPNPQSGQPHPISVVQI